MNNSKEQRKEPTPEQRMGQDMKRDTGSGRFEYTKENVSATPSNFNRNEEDKMGVHRRKMDNVQRLSSFKLLQDYSLTKHCFHTGLLFMEHAKEEGIEITLREVDFVLKHDILETVTGDMLQPAKKYNKTVEGHWLQIEYELTRLGSQFSHLMEYTDHHAENFMNDNSLKLFQACDLLELYEFCISECELGNDTVLSVVRNVQVALLKCKFKSISSKMHPEWI